MTVSISRNAAPAHGAWSKKFSRAIDQACEHAMARLFAGVHDERIKQALAQGFLSGVEWCLSEQSDKDIARATLALGLEPNEAVTGVLRKPEES